MVQKLLEHGASLYKVDKFGATPLLDAIRFKRKDVIRYVLCNYSIILVPRATLVALF
jgi:ankyrin repeat protein